MVAVLLKLKWANFAALFTSKNVWVIVGVAFGGLYALGAAFGLGALGLTVDKTWSLTFMVLFATVLSLIWWIVPLVAAAADATLDPERLAPYPLTAPQLMGGQVLGAFVGIPGAVTLVMSLAAATSLTSTGWALAFYPLSLVLGLALVVVVSRLITQLSIPLRARRGVTNLLTIISFSILVMLGPIMMGAVTGLYSMIDRLPTVVSSLQWTPFAAPWAVAVHAGQGNWGAAGLLVLVSLVYLSLAWMMWQRAMEKTMANVGALTAHKAAASLEAGKLGLMGLFPDKPRWAITARVLHMMFKDTRCNLNILMVPLFYTMFIFMGTSMSSREMGGDVMGLFFLTVFLPAFAGYIFAYLISYENTAFSMHVLAPLRGIEDRLGRLYAMLIIYLPLMLVGSLVYVLVSQQTGDLAPIMLTTVGVFLVSLGVSAVSDMYFSVPAPPPGSSPWKTPKQPDGFAKALLRGFIMLIPMVLSVPGGAGLLAQSMTGNPLWGWLGGGAMLILGLVILFLGIRLGSRRFEQHAADALQRVARFG